MFGIARLCVGRAAVHAHCASSETRLRVWSQTAAEAAFLGIGGRGVVEGTGGLRMRREDKARVASLLHFLRDGSESGRFGVDELSRRFRLDPMIVRRVCQAEGIESDEGYPVDSLAELQSLEETTPISLPESLGLADKE